MKVFIFKLLIAKLVLVSTTPEDIGSLRNQTQNLWSEFNQFSSELWSEFNQFSSDERPSRRDISSFSGDNSYDEQCPGTVVTLSPGYATRLKSHEGYGNVHYPSNYKVCK